MTHVCFFGGVFQLQDCTHPWSSSRLAFLAFVRVAVKVWVRVAVKVWMLEPSLWILCLEPDLLGGHLHHPESMHLS